MSGFDLAPSVAAPARRKARVKLDDYPTPAWPVRRLLEVPRVQSLGGLWLEPSAGAGAIIRTAEAEGVQALWTAVELNPAHREQLDATGAAAYTADFLDWARAREECPHLPPFDFALGNPPFSLALEFVQACLLVARQVCLLLRVGFLETEERNVWVRAHVPDLYVLPNRPQFRHGATDSCVYAWHWWPTAAERDAGEVRVLPSTSLAERRLG